MHFRGYLMVLALLLGSIALAPAASGESPVSEAVGQCQQGGWEVLVREDGTPFRNMGECVRHAAQGYAYGDDTTSDPGEPPVEQGAATLTITYHHFPAEDYGTCTYYAWLEDVTLEMPYVQVYHNDVPLNLTPFGSWRADENDPWYWTWSKTHVVDTETYVVFFSGPSPDSEIIATTNTVSCAYGG
jgi:hypothetical protein